MQRHLLRSVRRLLRKLLPDLLWLRGKLQRGLFRGMQHELHGKMQGHLPKRLRLSLRGRVSFWLPGLLWL